MPDGGDLAHEIATTIQTAHVKHNPDPHHDSNPSASMSSKAAVHVRDPQASKSASKLPNLEELASDELDELIPVLDPHPRTHNLPPLPDLRFEQSYLARIEKCRSTGAIAWVTFVDHVFLPLAQGLVWNLALFGWRSWNSGVKFNGRGVGARVRRWWWGVNKWKLPKGATVDEKK